MSGHKLIGECMLEDGIISCSQIEEVLSYQQQLDNKIPFGEICIQKGIITRKNLKKFLEKHKNGSKLGEILVQAGTITPEQLETALVRLPAGVYRESGVLSGKVK